MGFKPAIVTGKSNVEMSWPYLSWARARYYGDKAGALMGNREYPLAWETGACCALYAANEVISTQHGSTKAGSPHTWHGAEMFLYLLEAGGIPTRIAEDGFKSRNIDSRILIFGRHGQVFNPLGRRTDLGTRSVAIEIPQACIQAGYR